MTEEEINIAIATACGKKYHKPTEEEIARGSYYQYQPDYYRSLDAMHEAEKVLLGLQRDYCHKVTPESHYGAWTRYCDIIRQITDARNNYGNHIHATAAQRAEAFLRTLDLWKDDK